MRSESTGGHAPWFNLTAAHSAYTGGQYSLVRIGLAIFTALQLWHWLWRAHALFYFDVTPQAANANWILWAIPNVLTIVNTITFIHAMILFAIGLSFLLAIGLLDRFAAVGIWYILACLLACQRVRYPLNVDMGPWLMGWVLLAHAMLPASPYGSLGGVGRTDPAGGWAMPRCIFEACWFLLAVALFSTGISHLFNDEWTSGAILTTIMRRPEVRPVWLLELAAKTPDAIFAAAAWTILAMELLFAPLALLPRARPLIWAWTLVVHQAILASIIFRQLEPGLLMLYLICFNPAWIKPRGSDGDVEVIRYDGHCGLCHRAVRFVLAEDAPHPGQSPVFCFAPLADGANASSMTVETADGRTLTQSAAVLHILRRLGGLWVIVADFVGLVPKFLLDMGYRMLAALRYRLFPRPKDLCPIAPERLRSRFQPRRDAEP